MNVRSGRFPVAVGRPPPPGWTPDAARAAARAAAARPPRTTPPPPDAVVVPSVQPAPAWATHGATVVVGGWRWLHVSTRQGVVGRRARVPPPPPPPPHSLAAAYRTLGWSPSAALHAPSALPPVPSFPTRGCKPLPPRAKRPPPRAPPPPPIPGAVFADEARTRGEAWEGAGGGDDDPPCITLPLHITVACGRDGMVASATTRWTGVRARAPLDGVGAGSLARAAAGLDSGVGVAALGWQSAVVRRPGEGVEMEGGELK